MSEITWTFNPYNREIWNKSKTRVMFVGAEPNGAKKHKIKDMGEWFRIAPDGRKIKGTIHWVSSSNSFKTKVNLFNNLFTVEKPDEYGSIKEVINPNSMETFYNAQIENHLLEAMPGEKFQFERLGYFCVDQIDSTNNLPIFNRTVTLRDSWAKIQGTTNPKVSK